jgi:hypothetical protein
MNSTDSQTRATDFPSLLERYFATTYANSVMPARKPSPATETRFAYLCNSASSGFARRPPP